jgi:hypothetical protein
MPVGRSAAWPSRRRRGRDQVGLTFRAWGFGCWVRVQTPSPERHPKISRGAKPRSSAPFECAQRPKVRLRTSSPSEVPASPAAAQPGLTPRCAPSHGVRCSLESCLQTNCGGIGFPASATASDFHPGPRGPLRPPSTPSFDEVSSSFELSASCRVLRPACCPSCLVEPRDSTEQPKSASHGVLFPHRDVNRRRPPLRRESRPSSQVPPSTFLTSSTVYSATCLRGLVSSRCHVQGLPFRGLSLARSRAGFPRPHHALLALGAAACNQRPRPRLQGFALQRECGVGRNGLGLDRSAPLLGFSSSGSSPRATWECLHIPAALDLHREEPLAAGPRRLAVARIGWPGIRLPTRSSFPA